METNSMRSGAILLALLTLTVVMAAEPVTAEPEAEPETDQQCPAVVILTYDPYVVVKPDCLPIWPLPIPQN